MGCVSDYISFTKSRRTVATAASPRESVKGANFQRLTHKKPAITEAGNAHTPTTSWNVPIMAALYLSGDSSGTRVFWTGSMFATSISH